MKKLWDVIDLIDLKFSTLIFLITSFLLGNFKDIALYFFIALIHELMHFFACVHFKLAVKKLVVLPFGACLQVDKMDKVSSIKQIIIYMIGSMNITFSCFYTRRTSSYFHPTSITQRTVSLPTATRTARSLLRRPLRTICFR